MFDVAENHTFHNLISVHADGQSSHEVAMISKFFSSDNVLNTTGNDCHGADGAWRSIQISMGKLPV